MRHVRGGVPGAPRGERSQSQPSRQPGARKSPKSPKVRNSEPGASGWCPLEPGGRGHRKPDEMFYVGFQARCAPSAQLRRGDSTLPRRPHWIPLGVRTLFARASRARSARPFSYMSIFVPLDRPHNFGPPRPRTFPLYPQCPHASQLDATDLQYCPTRRTHQCIPRRTFVRVKHIQMRLCGRTGDARGLRTYVRVTYTGLSTPCICITYF